MTAEEAKNFEKELTDKGYVRYNSCLSSTEDFGCFKSFDVTYDEDGDRHIGYQVEYRFWDWTKYGAKDNEAFSIDIIIITSSMHRIDMVMSIDEYNNIEKVEKVSEDFRQFVIDHKLI